MCIYIYEIHYNQSDLILRFSDRYITSENCASISINCWEHRIKVEKVENQTGWNLCFRVGGVWWTGGEDDENFAKFRISRSIWNVQLCAIFSSKMPKCGPTCQYLRWEHFFEWFKHNNNNHKTNQGVQHKTQVLFRFITQVDLFQIQFNLFGSTSEQRIEESCKGIPALKFSSLIFEKF